MSEPAARGDCIELIQVDMMISMVDADGDGQVSYEEFHRLVVHPDPASEDFGRETLPKSDKVPSPAATQVQRIFVRGLW